MINGDHPAFPQGPMAEGLSIRLYLIAHAPPTPWWYHEQMGTREYSETTVSFPIWWADEILKRLT